MVLLEPSLLSVVEGVRQPYGYCYGDRQDGASLGHSGLRPAHQLKRRGAESAGGVVVAPARIADACHPDFAILKYVVYIPFN